VLLRETVCAIARPARGCLTRLVACYCGRIATVLLLRLIALCATVLRQQLANSIGQPVIRGGQLQSRPQQEGVVGRDPLRVKNHAEFIQPRAVGLEQPEGSRLGLSAFPLGAVCGRERGRFRWCGRFDVGRGWFLELWRAGGRSLSLWGRLSSGWCRQGRSLCGLCGLDILVDRRDQALEVLLGHSQVVRVLEC
jgi:hypothetical protein